MGFEGAEKKFEIVTNNARLLKRPESFWAKTVGLAGAQILSKVSNTEMTAYLLSESSLFVWDNRIVMLTCGRTSLIKALLHVLEEFGPENVDLLTYERKNEYYPLQQETDFARDVALIQKKFKGHAFRFGSETDHHLFLFHGEREFRPAGIDSTLEIFMYDFKYDVEEGVDLEKLGRILPGFKIDDHNFDPCGYSLNAIRGSDYYTIHVTPEENCSYASFETNVKLGNRVGTVLKKVIEIFKPHSFDVVYFHPKKALKPFDLRPFLQRDYYNQSISCGYEVGFSTYYLKTRAPMLAVPMEAET